MNLIFYAGFVNDLFISIPKTNTLKGYQSKLFGVEYLITINLKKQTTYIKDNKVIDKIKKFKKNIDINTRT